MAKVSENLYDAGGDGNLTTAKTFADGSTHYDTQYQYDWQNRQTDARGADGMASHSEYDNLGEMTLGQSYADADSDFIIDTGELRGQSMSRFDELGRVYSSTVYHVDPATGDLGHSLTRQAWYDPRGMR